MSLSTWYLPWIILSVPLIIFSMLGVYRVRVLTATATVTAAHFTVHKVAALEPTLPFFLLYFTTPAFQNFSALVTPVVPSGTCEFPTFMYITFLLFGLLGIFIVITKFRCGTLSPNSFTLVIEIGQQSTVIPVVTQSLPGCSSQYRFLAPKIMERIAIKGNIRPSLKVTWPLLRIFNTHLHSVFDLTKSIPLSFIQAYRLRKITRSPFWCMLTARYGYFAHRIDLLKTNDEGIEEDPSSTDPPFLSHFMVRAVCEAVSDVPPALV